MVKKQGRKNEPQNLAELKQANPKMSESDIGVAAKLYLDQAIIKMFSKHLKTLELLDKLEDQVKELRSSRDKFDSEMANRVEEWLGPDHPFRSLYDSEIYLNGLRDIARKKEKVKRVSVSGGRKTWDVDECLKAIRTVSRNSDGWAQGQDVYQAVNAISMDLAAKRLKLVTGELLSGKKGHEDREVKISKEYKWSKSGRSSYVVNLKMVEARLTGKRLS